MDNELNIKSGFPTGIVLKETTVSTVVYSGGGTIGGTDDGKEDGKETAINKNS